MLKLIQNELIKLFKKKTTIIMLAIILVATFGLEMFMKFYDEVNYYDWEEEYNDEYYDARIKELSEDKEGNKNSIEYYEKLKECKIYEYGWQMQGLNEAYEFYMDELENRGFDQTSKDEYKKQIESMIDAVVNNDYKLFIDSKAGIEKAFTVKYTFEDSEKAIYPAEYMSKNNRYFEYDSEEYNFLYGSIYYKQEAINSMNGSEGEDYKKALEDWKINVYRAENNIFTDNIDVTTDIETVMNYQSGFWKYMKYSVFFVILVCVYMIVIAGGIVSSEYSSGTIKFYLLNPKKRDKLILSKYLTIIIMTVFSLIVYFLASVIFSMIIGGTADMNNTYHIEIVNGAIEKTPALLILLQEYFYIAIEVIVMATMAFAISSLLKKTSISTGIGVACLIGGSILNTVMVQMNFVYGQYLIFANTDLLTIKEGNPVFMSQTLPMAVSIVVLHLVIFYLTARDAFVRREM